MSEKFLRALLKAFPKEKNPLVYSRCLGHVTLNAMRLVFYEV